MILLLIKSTSLDFMGRKGKYSPLKTKKEKDSTKDKL